MQECLIVLVLHPNRNPSPCRGKLDGVLHEVSADAVDGVCIPVARDRFGRALRLQREGLLRGFPVEHLHNLLRDVPEAKLLSVQLLDPRLQLGQVKDRFEGALETAASFVDLVGLCFQIALQALP